jgi:hypothetical protein
MLGISCAFMYVQLLQYFAFPVILCPHLEQYETSVFSPAVGRENDATDVDLDGS